MGRPIAFYRVNQAALANAPAIVSGFLPNGRKSGREWIAANPTRADALPNSFKVNLATGKWADFSSGERGGDLVALAALVLGKSQRDAAIDLAEALGVDPFE